MVTKVFSREVLKNTNIGSTSKKSFVVHNVSFARSREQNPLERLDGIVAQPQEWHKSKVIIFKRRDVFILFIV